MIEPFDCLIIGGGVNGTGLARDLAMRGISVCLVEKKDFASGASGANSGMIHGGIRYLRYDRRVTELAALDSGYIQRICPHLLFRIPFIYAPTAEELRRVPMGAWGIEIYFGTYDLYQRHKRGKPSTVLTADEVYALEPGFRAGVVKGFTIDEWGIDPWRLCLLNALSAAQHGAAVRPYTELVAFTRGERGLITGATLRDARTYRTSAISARLAFNCAGAWAPKVAKLAGVEVRIRAGKGVHVVFDRRVSNYGVICPAVDGREIFAMPYGDTSILGTTDDDYYGDPDRLVATQDEVEYLIEGAARALPRIREATIVRTYVGLRPTLYEYGRTEDALSREHEIYDHASEGAPGLFTLLGGKLASYRIQAQQAADLVSKRLGRDSSCRTHREPLPGGERFPDVAQAARHFGIAELTVSRLAHRQGSRTEAVLELAMREPVLRASLCPCEQVTFAEAAFCLRNEMVGTLTDLSRRCHLGWGTCQGTRCAAPAAHLFAVERGVKADQARAELLAFLADRFAERRPILKGPGLAQEELSRGVHFTVGNLDASLPA